MRPEDVDVVTEMWRVMAEQHLRYDSQRWDWADDYAGVQRHQLLETMEDPDHVLLVAEDETGRVVGYLLAFLMQPGPIWRVRRRAEVTDVFVAGRHGRKGIGQMLMDQAFDELRGRGAEDVILRVSEANRSAIKLYRKVGMRLVTHEMYRRL
ncbi:MAG: N-acetyltransferase family protein [Phycisphaerae bacterium]